MAGTIEKRGENSFRLTVYAGYDIQGKQIRHKKTIKVKAKSEKAKWREAEKALGMFQSEVEKGEFLGTGKMTFACFVQEWLAKYAEKQLAPKTVYRYREILNTRIIPVIGHMKMEKIRPVNILNIYDQLQQDGIRMDGKPGGLSPTTILQHHRVLSSIFSSAVQWQVVLSNPVSKVKPPKQKKPNIASYDEEQAAALLGALQKELLKYQVMVALALVTGCRRQELIAFQWEDIDFESSTIKVDRAAQYLPGRGMFLKDTKTPESSRIITLPYSIMGLLKEYRKHWLKEKMKVGELWQRDNEGKYSEEWIGLDLLFTTWNGWPMHIDTITKWFPKFLKRHNLPHVYFHSLRHTAATLLIGWGIPTRSVSSILGHARPSTTEDIYSKSLKSVEKVAAEKMEEMIFKNNTQ